MKKIVKRSVAVLICTAMAASFALAGCGQKEEMEKENSVSVEEDVADTGKKQDEGEKKNNDNLQKVTLNEVAHSIFYAPMYVAIEEGYFEEAGIELDLVTGFGADKVMTAVLSGEADIGFMGPETTVYTANEGSKDPVINFAQLTQRAGNFLVAREPMEDFEWKDLVGEDVLGGRAGGMPEMVFEFILKQILTRALILVPQVQPLPVGVAHTRLNLNRELPYWSRKRQDMSLHPWAWIPVTCHIQLSVQSRVI